MALYLITSLIDEGMYANDFIVVEAESELAIAAHMLAHPERWGRFLRSAYPSDWRSGIAAHGNLLDCARLPDMTPERFLELIQTTRVDGDSWAQLAIHEVTLKGLDEVDLW